VDNTPPATQDALRADFLLAQTTVAAGVVPSRDKKAQRAWDIWCAFCTSINANPDVSQMADPVTLLQTFGLRWRDGRISPSKEPNRSRSVEDTIRLVSQKFPSMGSKDPWLDESGKQDFRLRRTCFRLGQKKTIRHPESNPCQCSFYFVLPNSLVRRLAIRPPSIAFGWPSIISCDLVSMPMQRGMPSTRFAWWMYNSKSVINISLMPIWPPCTNYWLLPSPPSPSPPKRTESKVKSWRMPLTDN